jgi:uncharacterized protein (DUF983 family)
MIATCPHCHAGQNYLSLLFLGDGRTLACGQCGASLRARVNQGSLLPYALITGSVAAILAFTVVLSGDFVTTVALLLAWTLVSWAAYPLVLSLQSESK